MSFLFDRAGAAKAVVDKLLALQSGGGGGVRSIPGSSFG